ncbi:hypothetical protein CRG98_032236 [Punica granatum]|uniref:Uncharacterized protein n=1 Tax=Punica granatum TaxID=22663 RepID=A0A2I0ITS4_PUNGR|nr:hypothetical protein CRG98_032236 [Punica granatum]
MTAAAGERKKMLAGQRPPELKTKKTREREREKAGALLEMRKLAGKWISSDVHFSPVRFSFIRRKPPILGLGLYMGLGLDMSLGLSVLTFLKPSPFIR